MTEPYGWLTPPWGTLERNKKFVYGGGKMVLQSEPSNKPSRVILVKGEGIPVEIDLNLALELSVKLGSHVRELRDLLAGVRAVVEQTHTPSLRPEP